MNEPLLVKHPTPISPAYEPVQCPKDYLHTKLETISCYMSITENDQLDCKCSCGCKFIWKDAFHWRIISE